MSSYYSNIASYIESFLTYREALFYSNSVYRPMLASLDKLCYETFPDEISLTQEMVLMWMKKRPREGSGGLQVRSSIIRRFGTYMAGIGAKAYILPLKYTGGNSSFTPYIFSDAELSALFSAIDLTTPTRTYPFANLMLPVLFRLIYTCGLRPNEGRELLRKNVFLDTGEMLLTATKGDKERVVVMSEDMRNLCRCYDGKRSLFAMDNPYFFPGKNTDPMSEVWLQNRFRACWYAANPAIDPKKLPSVRVYDLRHRFASQSLQRWLDCGADLNAKLPYLRAYMGHSTLSQTAYYIHLLPSNLLNSAAIDWTVLSSMIPEVDIWQQ